MLPSLVSRVAPAATRGSALGVYNTFQFLGVFFGGFIGGTLYGKFGFDAVFMVCGLLLFVWVWLIQTAPELRLLDSKVVTLKNIPFTKDMAIEVRTKLEEVNGVEEVILVAGETIAYLKVNKDNLDNLALAEFIQ